MAAGMSIVLVFLLSVLAMPLPVGVSPMAEDPALLRVAPRDTIAYVEWFGAADPDPNSRRLFSGSTSTIPQTYDTRNHTKRRAVT